MTVRFTDRELDVMNVLWRHGPATVTDVRKHLDDELAYTTVLTILRILEDKGHVGHAEHGKAHKYFAKVDESHARSTALTRLVDRVFGGSAELLLTQLVSDRKLSAKELKRVRAFMDAQIKRSRKS